MMPPLSLYVHMPWCVAKCPYCDFNSHALHAALPRRRYLQALTADIGREAARAADREIASVFIGGGTPSLFAGEDIAALLETVAGNMRLQLDCEITLEANPGTLESGRLAAYRAAGANRLSLGAQSFDASALKRLGRIHGPQETHTTFAEARAAGFTNINLDLMFALPGQSVRGAVDDIDRALALEPEHISHYQLTLEPNTVFYNDPPPLPDDDASWEMQLEAGRRLRAAGFDQYEVSAFARGGFQCRHNLNYWRFGDYLAVGAGAHGKHTGPDGLVSRYNKPANPRAYMDAMADPAYVASLAAVDGPDKVFEYLLNALRLNEGFGTERLGQLDRPAREHLDRGLAAATGRGLLRSGSDGSWHPTELGFRFMNDLQALFLP